MLIPIADAAPKGWSRSVQPRVIIHVGIISNSHIAMVQNLLPNTLVRCTSHAMVVAMATANSETTVATQKELKIARPEYPANACRTKVRVNHCGP